MVSTPKAPSPTETAAAQSGMNLDTALTQQLVNQTNQVGPWGSTTYNATGTNSFVDSQGRTIDVPQFTQTTSYSPEQQAIFDKTTSAQTNIADIANQQTDSLKGYLNNKFDFGQGQFGGPDAASAQQFGGTDPFAYSNQDAEKWAYDLGQQRIAPQQASDRAALETQLTNKGIRPGTAAWNSEMERIGRTQSDQNNQLALTGRSQAFNEALGTQQNNFGQGLQTNQTNNASSLAAQAQAWQQALAGRQQNYQEAVTNRNQPLNEITALMSGSQIANPNQGTSATPQASVAGVDYTGLVNNQYQTQAANAGGALGGLFGLAGSLGGAAVSKYSDARVKQDISRVGTLDNGLPVYAYRYVWGGPMEIGVIAQDVERVNPRAVTEIGGIKAVDYGMAVQ